MKLINRTLLYLSSVLFVIIGVWAVLFYFQHLKQIKITIDEGLANYKIVIIDKLKEDTLIVQNDQFVANNYIVKNVSEEYALNIKDTYKDTIIFSPLKKTTFQTRLLTTAFAATDGKYYEMKMISQEIDKGKLIGKIATSLIWLYLFLFISILLVNNFVLKKTWKPFYQLLKYLNDFTLDKGVVSELPEPNIWEFSILNRSIINLLKANIKVFNSQKQFIENLSHELQTPLAVAANKLELLAGEKDISPELSRKIGNILESLERLAILNKSLLLLSKIENKQFARVEEVNFDELFNRVINDFSDYALHRNIKISYTHDGRWITKMNKDLSYLLILNLVKNAIVHNKQGGEAVIHLSKNHFTIENQSDNPAIDADTLFERFNRNAGKGSSTGLGLAIVKAIAEVSGLNITYSFDGNHVFRVSQSDQ
ncbi:MAG: sensor histidine kinase [Bacteroidales bacterium]